MPLTNQLWSVSLTSLGNLDRCEADLSPWCYNLPSIVWYDRNIGQHIGHIPCYLTLKHIHYYWSKINLETEIFF